MDGVFWQGSEIKCRANFGPVAVVAQQERAAVTVPLPGAGEVDTGRLFGEQQPGIGADLIRGTEGEAEGIFLFFKVIYPRAGGDDPEGFRFLKVEEQRAAVRG